MKKIIICIIPLLAYIIYYLNIDRNAKIILINEIKDEKLYFKYKKTNLTSIISPNYIIEYQFTNNLMEIKKVDTKIIEKYLWFEDSKIHIVFDKNDNILEKYNYANKNDLLPFSMEKNGNTYFFIYNEMKSLRVVVDKNQNIIKTINYDQKGNIIEDSNPSFLIRYGYAGGFYDNNSSLLYFKQGIYYPKKSVWITKVDGLDIIENLKQLNKIGKNEVYKCSSTIDKYYHSYICLDKKCIGFYLDDIKYFDAKGLFLDNSYFFNKNRCEKISINNKKININNFKSCIHSSMQMNIEKKFDLFTKNCHTESSRIVKKCLDNSPINN